MDVTILGLSITSSWGNGHATTYRGLVRELAARGHRVTFLERDVPWYAENRDLPEPPWGRTFLYRDLSDLRRRFRSEIVDADAVVIGSYVPEGTTLIDEVLRHARGVTAFYDIDTPVTLAALEDGSCDYLRRDQIPRFDLYLSFTGGPTLDRLEGELGARRARALFCSFDPEEYFPEVVESRWDLGYLGTYSPDRQPKVEELLLGPAGRMPRGRFIVAGPQYPEDLAWPGNVERTEHLPPHDHRSFYNAQRYTLNVTRAAMVRAGWSPSVRLFEAAACGIPVISDAWPGLEEVFRPGEEILVARSSSEVVEILRDLPEPERREIGVRARGRALREHTAEHRALTLESLLLDRAEAPLGGRPVRAGAEGASFASEGGA